MKILDLYCKAGGASEGLHLALPTAEIVGVDIEPQPHYPFRFVQADAMTYPLDGFDFIWASPPCQRYSTMTGLKGKGRVAPPRHLSLIEPTRARLERSGKPYIIENVVGAPLLNPVRLCGSSFGLAVRRHRLFESNLPLLVPACQCRGRRNIAVYGKRPGDRLPDGVLRARDAADASRAMGIDWMDWQELTQAIPPAFARYLAQFVPAPVGAYQPHDSLHEHRCGISACPDRSTDSLRHTDGPSGNVSSAHLLPSVSAVNAASSRQLGRLQDAAD